MVMSVEDAPSLTPPPPGGIVRAGGRPVPVAPSLMLTDDRGPVTAASMGSPSSGLQSANLPPKKCCPL